MVRVLLIRGVVLILSTAVWGQLEGSNNNDTSTRWNISPESSPAALTVKKAARSSNVERAVALTEQQKNEIVDRHNLLRTVVQPSATKMRKMTWDDELEKVATDYSRKCIYEHNKGRTHSRFNYIGENLYISTGIPMNTVLVVNAVSAWDAEKVDYDYETRKCQPGKKCGHYTQTAWDDTFKVGCGVTICKVVNVNGRNWKSATLFACNYGPGGNYDRHPFEAGPSCSNCDEGDICEDNLCVNAVRDVTFDSVEATWSEWSSWSTCSKTCIGGSATRSRTCSSFVPSDCDGYSKEMTYMCSSNLCNLHPLGPSGGTGSGENFLPWGEWSECSKTCGTGVKARTRKCKNRQACSGINKLTTSCIERQCGDGDDRGDWTLWGRWGACTVTCGGGVQKKKRSCQGSGCSGRREMTKDCNPLPCKTVPRWSEWSAWNECSATCGRGSKTRTRRCLTGRNCEGLATATDVCNTHRCRGKYSTWSQWSECSKSCGNGFKNRERTCVVGRDCVGSPNGRERCNRFKCPEFREWSEWASCDATCGTGNKIRTRTCSSANLNDCDGERTQVVTCRATTRCTVTGWNKWAPWSRCSVTCGGGVTSSVRVCNVGNSGPANCTGSTRRSKSCNNGICPKWNDWLSWGKCSVSCGGGVMSRARTCNVGTSGPATCPGARTEQKSCNREKCPTPTPKEKDPPNKPPGERDEDQKKDTKSRSKEGGENSGSALFSNAFIISILSVLLFLQLE